MSSSDLDFVKAFAPKFSVLSVYTHNNKIHYFAHFPSDISKTSLIRFFQANQNTFVVKDAYVSISHPKNVVFVIYKNGWEGGLTSDH